MPGTIFWHMVQGFTGSVVAALASLCLPGLGQLLQGRWLAAFVFFVLAGLWIIGLGPVVHVAAGLEAAVWQPKTRVGR